MSRIKFFFKKIIESLNEKIWISSMYQKGKKIIYIANRFLSTSLTNANDTHFHFFYDHSDKRPFQGCFSFTSTCTVWDVLSQWNYEILLFSLLSGSVVDISSQKNLTCVEIFMLAITVSMIMNVISAFFNGF